MSDETIVMIESHGYCSEVRPEDRERFEKLGYRPWYGPVPKPGQHTIAQVPGIRDYLKNMKEAGPKKPDPEKKALPPKPVTDAPAPVRVEKEEPPKDASKKKD